MSCAGVDRATRPPESLPTAFGPSGPATITVSAMPTNNPCSTTPVIFFSSSPNSPGFLTPPSIVRSRTTLPLSVMYGVSSPPRMTRLTPSPATRSAVDRQRNGSTSTGSTPTPSCLTSFDSSTTTTKRFEAVATSFSRKSAPPRPLIRFKAGSTSSARSEEHTSELQSRFDLVCRLLLEKKKHDTLQWHHPLRHCIDTVFSGHIVTLYSLSSVRDTLLFLLFFF